MKLHRSIRFVLGALAGLATSTLFTSQAAAQCLIEPFGDSLTAGIGSAPVFAGKNRGAGYRAPLMLAPLTPVLSLVFVGGRDENIPEAFPMPPPPGYFIDSAGPILMPYHSGVPGWRNDQLQGAVLSNYPVKPFLTTPHIVLVHAGTNDILQGVSAADAANRLDLLLRALATRYPYAKIIVAKIIPLAGAFVGLNATVSIYNNGLAWPYTAGIVQKVAALNVLYPGKFSIADLNTGFPTATLAGDGIHPDNTGYYDMAENWSTAIKLVATSAGCVPL